MNKLQLVLKRTLFYPSFLMLSSGFFLLEFRGLTAIATAAGLALGLHLAVNGYDVWKERQASLSSEG
ncbi:MULTISPECIES: hypothetical protein [unclassified Oceanobacter]|jgi:hypothetical protein|uniref:hypothetical protein n=1 Tax=unclassified Oceanobacter TaxID=2620260 RepID=UPI0026E39B5E|nr:MULTISPECIES: hypothetical protein [unclassified Oceanobacter]MDO6683427.1 hypothetical protein [Oceanobacter sp. 5_MG-2023]MDP2506903.1 hypothetical protein [Oceanobacter sp. 3_MG-2023]MDP2547770.1 hypothetical protein [Oceanobacter sp. 4_MG-2023]MDP2608454.1 hypothetical protein [Oceanobacter sp. 1_MG-2023]MDP2611549.1 hypothetical protein [Oceanobacter sp. 2_MG-2023]